MARNTTKPSSQASHSSTPATSRSEDIEAVVTDDRFGSGLRKDEGTESPSTVRLASGHEVRLPSGSDSDSIEIRDGDGALQVRVELTENGPRVEVTGGSLEVKSPGKVNVRCRDMEIQADRKVRLEAGEELEFRSRGEIRTKAGQQVFIDGDYVNLNCLDRKGYHDENPSGVTEPVEEESTNLRVGEDGPAASPEG